MIGNVTIDAEGTFIREYTYDNEKKVISIPSPFRQAEKHKEIYKKIWLNNHNNIVTRLFENFFDKWYKPLVVMAEEQGNLYLDNAPEDIKDKVVRSDNLVRYIKSDIARVKNKNELAKKKDMEGIANRFLELNCMVEKDYLDEYMKKYNISKKDMYREKLRGNLLNFRKRRTLEKNISEDYVFTDEELEKLLKYLPKDIGELRRLKIMADIRVKCHGEDIIRVINNS